MIQIGDQTYAFDDPMVIAALIGAAAVILLFVLLIMSVRRAGQSARMVAPLSQQMGFLGQQVQTLSDGQHQLAGGLNHVSEAQAASQTSMLKLMEERLAAVQESMGANLEGSARRTAQSLGDLQQRLQTIDKAQSNIEKLSGDVLSLQDILSNKQTRGAFGEIQLTDAIAREIENSNNVYGYRFRGQRFDCGSKAGYLQATVAFGLAREELGEELGAYLESMVNMRRAAQ